LDHLVLEGGRIHIRSRPRAPFWWQSARGAGHPVLVRSTVRALREHQEGSQLVVHERAATGDLLQGVIVERCGRG
ncbi:MAG: hypothetical protein LC118_16970, partial [Dehalococcoidia bacterium]|nr:hypothetical protein [Dehalococcoidia bacterium]